MDLMLLMNFNGLIILNSTSSRFQVGVAPDLTVQG